MLSLTRIAPCAGERVHEIVVKSCPFSNLTVTPDGEDTLAVGSDRKHMGPRFKIILIPYILSNGNFYHDVNYVAMLNFHSVAMMSHDNAVLSSRYPSQESLNNSTCITLRSLPLPYLKMGKFWWLEQPPGRYFFSNIPSGNHNQQSDQFRS